MPTRRPYSWKKNEQDTKQKPQSPTHVCTSVCRVYMHTKKIASFHGSLSFSRASHDVSVSVTVFSTLHPLEPNQERRQTKSSRPQKRSFVFIKSDSNVGFRRCHQACKKLWSSNDHTWCISWLSNMPTIMEKAVAKPYASDGLFMCHPACKKNCTLFFFCTGMGAMCAERHKSPSRIQMGGT